MKFFLFFFLTFSQNLLASRFVVEVEKSFEIPTGLKVESLFFSKQKKLSKYKVISGNISKNELEKMKGVLSVEAPVELTRLTLRPGKSLLPSIQDELFTYQWGLFNQGQIFFKEKDDIHNLPLLGKDGFDVGGREFLESSVEGERKVIVAVLDSGVDLDHFELKNNLWKNSQECGKDPNVDNDGNQLKGDCLGWNFTEAIDSEEAKVPFDQDGHGTHVAGIIASEKNNKGIVGVFPGALIMPIKVLRDSNSSSEISSSEAFARGITYAVDQGAQVINLSLGWPRTLETKFLRDAVLYALSQGVVLVAAAGNNNSSEPLYPCAYEGVICVGSTSLNGEVSRFSNFGGHVDTLAPGEGILSLHPTLFEPDFFTIPGFEIRSGTSQSAPFVSGLVARALSENPGLRIDDFFAKLYLAKRIDSDKAFLGGVAHYKNLQQEVSRSVIRPILKRVRQVLLNGTKGKIRIPLRNFGTLSSQFRIQVRAKNKAVSVLNSEFSFSPLRKGEGVEFEVELQVNKFEEDHLLELEIQLTSDDEIIKIDHSLPILRDLRAITEVEEFSFDFKNQKIPLGGVKNGQLVTFLNTLETLGESNSHELFLNRVLKDQATKDLELTLFRKEGSVFKQAGRFILIPFGLNLVNFYKMDLNFDNRDDYFLQVLCEKEGKKYFSFIYLNEDLLPLWSRFPEFKLELDFFVENLNQVSFLKKFDTTLGNYLTPTFFTNGEIPLLDQVLSVWEKVDKSRKERLYYLERSQDKFILRSPTHLTWEKAFRESMKLDWKDTIVFEALLPQTDHDLKRGEARILISYGRGSRRNFMISRFLQNELQRGNLLPQLVFQTESIKPLFYLDGEDFIKEGEVYFNIYDRQRGKLIYTNELNQVGEKIIKNETSDDVLINHLASYKSASSFVSILESREELIWLQHGVENFEARRPKLRYSFLSQKMLSEIYLPVTIKDHDKLRPALYLDMTPLTGNRLSLLTEVNRKFTSTIKNSLSVPVQCRPLRPHFSQAQKIHEFVFLCQEGENFVIKTLPMDQTFEGAGPK